VKKLIVLICLLLLMGCEKQLENDVGLNCLWVTWSDDGSHISYYYAYGCNNSDSILFINGNHRFYKSCGIEYDCFKIDCGIDSIVMFDEYGEQRLNPVFQIDTLKYVNKLSWHYSERIKKSYWLAGCKSGYKGRVVGFKFSDWRNE